MTSYPLLSRVCAIAPAQLEQALDTPRFRRLIEANDLESLKEAVADAELGCLDAVIELLFQPHLRTALHTASASALRDIEKYTKGKGRRFRYGARLQRSVLSYATRATLKPSPFSHFTRLGHAGPEDGWHETYTQAPTFETASIMERVRHGDDSLIDQAVVNPTLRLIDGRLLGWRASYFVDRAFAWRSDDIVDATGWAVDEDLSTDSIVRPAGDPDRILQLMDGTASIVVDDLVHEAQGPDGGQGVQGDNRSRLSPDPEIGVSVSGNGGLAPTYHVVREHRPQPELGRPSEVAVETWLRSRLRINSLYLDSVTWAAKTFGNGVEVDFAEFMIRAVSALEPAMPKISLLDPSEHPIDHVVALPPTAAVFWHQLPELGPDMIVVNNSNGPGLGATLRWGGPIAERGAEVVRRIETDHDLTLMPFTYGDEWNGIQTCAGKAYSWPTGRFQRPNDLPLREMVVRVESDRLTVLRNGEPVVPVYSGAMPEHRLTGPARIFSMLGMPWLFEYGEPKPDGPVWGRRILGDHLVTRRAGAAVTPAEIERWRTLELHRAMKEMYGWAADRDLPSALFYRKGSADGRTPQGTGRKPSFVDLASPHLVASFLHAAAEAEELTVEEALPRAGSSPATEEFVSLFVLADRTPGNGPLEKGSAR